MPLAVIAQEDHGGGGGGGGGCGDVFGDLIHILRNDEGQPILAQRWVELPAEVPGYGWGYCPIAVDADGNELPFVPYSCDIADPDSVQEVNYFGRLSGGRTKERNNRMHFDEVISNIKAAHLVKTDPAGRLMLGYDCTYDENKDLYKAPCLEWATIDSPMEHMGLYSRIMKYGHLATDPYEIDTWAHGDPKAGTQFHVALGPEDFAKFHSSLQHLLPKPPEGLTLDQCWDYDQAEEFVDDGDGVWFAGEPFFDMNDNCIWDDGEPFTDIIPNEKFDAAEEILNDNGNCVRDEFKFICAGAEYLDNKDFISGAISLSSAASKTGMITTDLIQYFNRILKIAKKTEATVSNKATLPALYRDCWPYADPNFGEEPPPEELPYLTGDNCAIVEPDFPDLPKDDPGYCAGGTPNHCLYPDIEERFVNFNGLTDYEREGENVVVLINTTATNWDFPIVSVAPTIEASASYTWEVTPESGLSLLTWVEAVNGEIYATEGIDGFRDAASDILRTIEFIHNYEVPEVLECSYATTLCALE